MNRVEEMPIRVRCNYTMEDNRWKGEKIKQGKEFDLYSQSELDWLLREHPGCVCELEMTEEDWIELATKEALRCKEIITRLEKSTGRKFHSWHQSVIPAFDGEKVDGHGYGGGLPDAYRHLCTLKDEVTEFRSKSPKFDVVKGMPIRVRCNYTIEDNRWKGEKIEQGKEFDLYSQSELDCLLREHPGCVCELEMTEEDWIELATKEALRCKEIITRLEKSTGRKFDSWHQGVIPAFDGDKVDGHGYGGGLPDAYRHLCTLKDEVTEFQSKSPKLDVVEGMPIRIVCTKRIQDDKILNKQIKPGTILNLTSDDFEYFLEHYNGHFEEIEMSKDDWIELATKEAIDCSKKIQLLQKVSGKRFESYHTSVIPRNGRKVDGSGYGLNNDFCDAYNHLRSLQKDVEKFEEDVYQQFDSQGQDR